MRVTKGTKTEIRDYLEIMLTNIVNVGTYIIFQKQHLEENVREKLHNIGFDNDFRYDIEGRGNERKKRINWTTSKLKISIKQHHQ